jgi:hypothetical protein
MFSERGFHVEDADDFLSDHLAPEPHTRPKRSRLPDEDDEPAGGHEPEEFDPESALPGAVLMVPNRHWGFEVASAADHPGVCTHHRPATADAVLVKGTDAEHVRFPHRYFIVRPTDGNGLSKRTAFELVPRPFRLHRLKLFFPERHLGRVDEFTLQHLQAELARLHPEG